MKVELIIPTHDNDGSDNAVIIESAVADLCKLYGGATVYAASGFWVNDAGRLFEDQVKVLVSAATDKDAAKAELRNLAKDILEITDQEAVFVSVGGEAEIIE
ncbi:molybdenum cofactor biosynthesis protein MoaE [Ruegeria litorea]|uniref:Molybdenum cofactor biosynthesis protein MoaE n=1 Tax=Falsiruegeria litorea TaxID=1280831 RepID=A0ABS5WUW0_9RHOB|nr:molybdenum cofactor biosynthesis protein MoaE [Falsiruegeria litorea]MBT3142927.1 molybdenum cofactor biosynthesis protein MoaE [Falsiruegeria litorea]